MHQRQ
jgi:hypothetical protein